MPPGVRVDAARRAVTRPRHDHCSAHSLGAPQRLRLARGRLTSHSLARAFCLFRVGGPARLRALACRRLPLGAARRRVAEVRPALCERMRANSFAHRGPWIGVVRLGVNCPLMVVVERVRILGFFAKWPSCSKALPSRARAHGAAHRTRTHGDAICGAP
jgi:hypothetical protein